MINGKKGLIMKTRPKMAWDTAQANHSKLKDIYFKIKSLLKYYIFKKI